MVKTQFVLIQLGGHFCTIILVISAQSDEPEMRRVAAHFCAVCGILRKILLGFEKPLRVRSIRPAFVSSVRERVILEKLHPRVCASFGIG